MSLFLIKCDERLMCDGIELMRELFILINWDDIYRGSNCPDLITTTNHLDHPHTHIRLKNNRLLLSLTITIHTFLFIRIPFFSEPEIFLNSRPIFGDFPLTPTPKYKQVLIGSFFLYFLFFSHLLLLLCRPLLVKWVKKVSCVINRLEKLNLHLQK